MTVGKPITAGAAVSAVAVTPDGKTTYVVSRGSVTPVDTATGIAGKPIRVPGVALSVTVSPNGRTVYVGSYRPGRLITISTAANRVSRIVQVGKTGPISVAIGP
jgi:YVTN family beta-propeller protein